MFRTFLAAMIATLFFVHAANAGPIESTVKQAIELAKAGKAVKAFDTMEEARFALWQQLDFQLRKAVFVDEKAKSFGHYRPRKDNGYYPLNATMRVYLEPLGFTWKREPGRATMHIIADIKVFDANKKQIFSKNGFGNFRIVKLDWTPRFFMNLSLNTQGLVPGEYRIQFILNDILGNKVQKVNFDIIIQPAE
jgi:hypothetical protein